MEQKRCGPPARRWARRITQIETPLVALARPTRRRLLTVLPRIHVRGRSSSVFRFSVLWEDWTRPQEACHRGGGRALLVPVAAWAPRTGRIWRRTRRPPAHRGGSALPGRASSDPFPATRLVRVSSTARPTPHHPRPRARPGQRRANDRWAPVSTFGFPPAHCPPTAPTTTAHTRPARQGCVPARSRAHTHMHASTARHGRVDRTVGRRTTASGTHASRRSPGAPVGEPNRRV